MYDETMYQGTGLVRRRWANSIERNFVMWAQAEIVSSGAVRSGELLLGIHGSVVRTGPRKLEVYIESQAEHSMWVIQGTTGPIMTTERWMGVSNKPMALRPGNGWPAMRRAEVAGQRPNNFMGRAADRVARRHSSLRGFSPGVTFW